MPQAYSKVHMKKQASLAKKTEKGEQWGRSALPGTKTYYKVSTVKALAHEQMRNQLGIQNTEIRHPKLGGKRTSQLLVLGQLDSSLVKTKKSGFAPHIKCQNKFQKNQWFKCKNKFMKY